MTINILDFENADIGRLAIHLREALHPKPIKAIRLNNVGNVPYEVITGPGLFVGYAVFNGGGGGDIAFLDGALADSLYVYATNIAAGLLQAYSAPCGGLPFFNSLTVVDTAQVAVFAGQVFVRPL